MNSRRATVVLCLLLLISSSGLAQSKIAPYDLWNSQVLAAIKDQSTLETNVVTPTNLFSPYEVYFTSNPSASYFDASAPYTEHTGEKITIHAYLAVPAFGSGPFPAIVIGHGHGGQADPTLAATVALLGYVALAIDGPQAGKSTGGPKDDNQAWISVDNGPQYGYLYHYAYAGMRGLTLLQSLAKQGGNPYRIDASKLAVLGASMGGIFTTYINGIDDRVKAAIAISAAGNWHHSLRDPNSWLYHGLYFNTRDKPYNGNDPQNSIENVDTDSTAITFFEYFDPIRYATTQHAPLLTIMGTHDGYFPLPEANLTELAIGSAGTLPNFEKRLWLIPNATHGLSTSSSSASVSDFTPFVTPILEWLDYCFGKRTDKPLATPTVSATDTGSGLRFDIAVAPPSSGISISQVDLFIASKVDSTVVRTNPPINDFADYKASLLNGVYSAKLPSGQKSSAGDVLTTDNAIYFATVKDSGGLMVSSLVYKGGMPIDLTTDFTPGIDQFPGDASVAPVPAPYTPAATSLASSISLPADSGYQGMALTNPTANNMMVRVDARTADGRLGAAEGLINPVFMTMAPHSQRIFVAEEWFGPGARQLNGSFRMGWSDAHATSLAFRGTGTPSQLDAIGPLSLSSTPLWLPLVTDQDPLTNQYIRIMAAPSTTPGSNPQTATLTFYDSAGNASNPQTVSIPASGTADYIRPYGFGTTAYVRIDSAAQLAARLEVSGAGDPWSIEARSAPSAVTTLIQPHVEINGTFTTRLVALNTSSQSQNIAFILYSYSPTRRTVSRTIPAGGVLSETVESLFGIQPGDPAGAGLVELDPGDPRIIVSALAVDSKHRAAAANPVGQAAAGSFSMPFYVQGTGYWTGLAIANSGNVASTVTITAYDPTGTNKPVTVTPDPVQPGSSATLLLSQWMPALPGDSTGQLIITATAPVSLLAYFGTGDALALAAIPFTPIVP